MITGTFMEENTNNSDNNNETKSGSLVKLENEIDINKRFYQLNKDTDLNKITENWFWKSSLINYFTKWTHKKQNDLFSSLKLADKYVDNDLIGQIDVVTDAEASFSN